MVAVLRISPYGASEINSLYRANITRGLLTAISLHLILFGIYAFVVRYEPEPPQRVITVERGPILVPPPPLVNSVALPVIALAGKLLAPGVGTPVPVPDPEISPEQTIATQEEMNRIPGSGDTPGARPGDIIVETPVEGGETPPDAFVPFEKAPQIIHQVQPLYPEIARRAGLEGTVNLRVWIDKEGSVRKAEVLRSNNEIFNQPAIDAVMQWRFTPAVMNSGAVAVWAGISVKFKLSNVR